MINFLIRSPDVLGLIAFVLGLILCAIIVELILAERQPRLVTKLTALVSELEPEPPTVEIPRPAPTRVFTLSPFPLPAGMSDPWGLPFIDTSYTLRKVPAYQPPPAPHITRPSLKQRYVYHGHRRPRINAVDAWETTEELAKINNANRIPRPGLTRTERHGHEVRV